MRDVLWVVPRDVKIVPADQLGPKAVQRILRRTPRNGTQNFIVHRPLTRTAPKLVDASVKRILDRFRRPANFLDVVLETARAEAVDPFTILKQLQHIMRRLTQDGLLVNAVTEGRNPPSRPEPSLMAGSRLVGYKIIACVRLTMDVEIYLVEGRKGQRYALKSTFSQYPSSSAQWYARCLLEREVAALRALDGTAAVRLIEDGEIGSRRYAVVEWIDGPSVERRAQMIRKDALPTGERWRRLLLLVTQCLKAISSLHRRGYLHGEIHPQNFIMQGDLVRAINLGSSQKGSGMSEFPGIFPYVSPEGDDATLNGQRRFRKSFRSEVYSAGVLAYRLLTGLYLSGTTSIRKEGVRNLSVGSVRPLEALGLEPFMAVEKALRKALSGSPSKRFRSVDALARALTRSVECLDQVRSYPRPARFAEDGNDARRALRREARRCLGELRRLDFTALQATQIPPHASVFFGGAGIAFALLRAAKYYDDAKLLALAESWIDSSLAVLSSRTAFHGERSGLMLKTVRPCSVYNSEAGLYVAQALVAHARHATATRERAFKRLSGFMTEACRGPLNLFFGLPGWLVSMSLLASQTGDPRSLVFGRRFCQALLLRARPRKGIDRRVPSWDGAALGFAHGWAGIHFSLLQWALQARATLPPWVKEDLMRLIKAGVPEGGGLNWPAHRDVPQGRCTTRLCDGAPGVALTMVRAHEVYGEREFLEAARAAARCTVERQEVFGDICCGLAGQAYSLLAVSRIDPTGPWREVAIDLALQSLVPRTVGPWRYSLFKGLPGSLCLALDLLDETCVPLCPFIES